MYQNLKQINTDGWIDMDIRKIVQEYLESPENVYARLTSFDDSSRKMVYLLEEMFAGMKFSGLEKAADEQYVAEMADKIRKGEFKGNIDPKDIEAVSDILTSLAKMDVPVKRAVPEALMAVIDRTLDVKDKKQIPSFIVRLTREGIKTILSGLNGVTLTPVPVPAMRSPGTLEKEIHNVQLEQIVDGNKIGYSILKESDEDIMLAMNFPDKIGRCRVILKENDRMISTENLNDGDDSVNFRKLKPGYYDISITGSINHSFTILVDA